MAPVAFRKMHGLGNDFVVLDARTQALAIGPDSARRLADRHSGIGCDQLIVLVPPGTAEADVDLVFYNADGSLSGACGNGTRCVASLVMTQTGRRSIRLRTAAGETRIGRTRPSITTKSLPSPCILAKGTVSMAFI